MDGLIYAVVARNMAAGLGTFWNPHLSNTLHSDFYLSPPLGLGIEAIFFKIFGDHLLVERFYSFGTGLLTAFFMTRIWKTATRSSREPPGLGWMPVLFWTIIPLNFWSFSNNMLENTMGVFTILSVFLLLKAMVDHQKVYLLTIAAGACIVAGVLSKVPTALFPLAVPGIYWVVFRTISFKKALGVTALLLITAVSLFSLVLLNPEANHNLSQWFQTHLVRSFRGEIEPTARYNILKRLFLELVPAIALSTLLWFFQERKKIGAPKGGENLKWPLVFFLIGLSASLPIALSPNQKGYYLVPSFPYYAIALAFLTAPAVGNLLKNLNPASRIFKVFTSVSLASLTFVLIFSLLQIGKTGRDHELLHDVRVIGKNLPANSTIGMCSSMRPQWTLHGYFARYFNISLDAFSTRYDYYLTQDHCNPEVETSWKEVPLETKIYKLYRRQ